MGDDTPPLEIARVGGLFSERQIIVPLVVATLIALAISLTVAHFQALATLPAGLRRYFGNGYCQVMIGLFFAITLYAALHYLGLHVERRHLQQRFGSVATRAPRGGSTGSAICPDTASMAMRIFPAPCDAGTATPARGKTSPT